VRAIAESRTVDDASGAAIEVLAENPYDLPFAAIYLLDDDDAATARLVRAARVEPGSRAAPRAIALADGAPDASWPLATALQTLRTQVVSDLGERFGALPGGAWPEPPRECAVLPIFGSGLDRVAGFFVAGISARRALDEGYRDFLALVGGHVRHRDRECARPISRRSAAPSSSPSSIARRPLLQQRQPRVPHAADADPRSGRRPARRAARRAAAGAADQLDAREPQCPAAAAAS
jgi:hypothetical protein